MDLYWSIAAQILEGSGIRLLEMMFGLGKENRCTIVVTTHDQEILRLADKVVRLRDGSMES